MSDQQQEINDIFSHMEAAIRLNEYKAHDFLFMVTDLIPANPTLAASIGKHAAEFIESDACRDDSTWTDIVVEAYRRALFDVTLSPKYGTGWMVKNIPAMRTFVEDYVRNHTMGSELIDAPATVN